MSLFNTDRDFSIISKMIPSTSKIIDVGCGDGSLLDYLIKKKNIDGRGLEIDQDKIRECLARGISVIQGDAEEIVSKNYSARKVEYIVRNKKSGKIEKTIDTNILKTQERLQKILGLKVNIVNKKNNSGKITIKYKDLDQFQLISDLLTKH